MAPVPGSNSRRIGQVPLLENGFQGGRGLRDHRVVATAFHPGLGGNLEDIVGDVADGSWYVPKAGEVVDVDDDRAIMRNEHIQTIDVQPEDFADAPRQRAPLGGQWKKLLLHCHLGMKW